MTGFVVSVRALQCELETVISTKNT